MDDAPSRRGGLPALDIDVPSLIRDYCREWLSVREVAHRYRISYGAAHKRIKAAGVMRPRGVNRKYQVRDDK
jgi:hypothetical protein